MDEAALKTELNKIPMRYCIPIYAFSEGGSLILASGTLSLVEINNRMMGITNHHVVDRIRALVKEGAKCRVGASDYEISEIKRDTKNDLCALEIPEEIIYGFVNEDDSGASPRFFEYLGDPAIVTEGKLVSFGGYPTCLRETEGNESVYFSYSHGGCKVSSCSDNQFYCQLDPETEELVMGEKDEDSLKEFGGISGGPVFTWSDEIITRIQLVGILKEGNRYFFGSDKSYIAVAKAHNFLADL